MQADYSDWSLPVTHKDVGLIAIFFWSFKLNGYQEDTDMSPIKQTREYLGKMDEDMLISS